MQSLMPCPVCICDEAALRYRSTLKPGERWHADLDPYSGHYQINVCRGCGLVFSDPIFGPEEIAALYQDHPRTNADESETRNVRATMAGYYAMAAPFLTSKRRALDVGCDVGLMLDVVRADGFRELHGIEPVAVARAAAKARLKHAHIHSEFYRDARFPADHFDLISFIHVLDHLEHPAEALRRAQGHLAPGGIAVAVVHDIEAPLARLMGERYAVFNFFHHYFFSRATLARLFDRCGYEVLAVAPTRNRYSVAYLTERFPLLPKSIARQVSRWSRSLGVGKLSLDLKLGNIGIVARKPAS